MKKIKEFIALGIFIIILFTLPRFIGSEATIYDITIQDAIQEYESYCYNDSVYGTFWKIPCCTRNGVEYFSYQSCIEDAYYAHQNGDTIGIAYSCDSCWSHQVPTYDGFVEWVKNMGP